ncbi:protease inhibitor I42 family protein [Specibacter cremeus]|uniref:protease inhibitor I42 family protein n=1 Tax=Specibacter cremeus TaxID=1629051 RepID=UPI000F770786|nr:protease inhibitor I42 family protein [Specibacter cremeus]
MINVVAGEMFTVDFRATPSTGYQWSVTGIPDAVELVENRFVPDGPAADPAPRAGAGGTHTFTFLANHNGRIVLHFELKRVWEETGIDHRDVAVTIG